MSRGTSQGAETERPRVRRQRPDLSSVMVGYPERHHFYSHFLSNSKLDLHFTFFSFKGWPGFEQQVAHGGGWDNTGAQGLRGAAPRARSPHLLAGSRGAAPSDEQGGVCGYVWGKG